MPIGLWGFSQGAWVASIAAGRSDRIGYLVLIGASGVSPADQMRYSAAEALHRAGYGTGDIVRAVDARRGVEAFLRGDGSHADAQRAIDSITSESWFDLLYLPHSLAPDATWRDMDYDPIPAIRGVGCPVLLIYGDDEVVPAEASIAAWREGTVANGTPLEVVRLPDSSHLPTLEGATSTEAVDPAYEAAITGWLDRFVTHAATR